MTISQGRPDKLLFIDCETTGLFSSDKIVSLGMVELSLQSLLAGRPSVELRHMIFDPGKKSHPRAEEVHGYDDWLLRHQDPFSMHAKGLADIFNANDLVVAHNASFDQRFIVSAFQDAGHAVPSDPFHCTMMQFRRDIGGPSGLNAVLAKMGKARVGARHGALEDAFLAMCVYCWLHDLPVPQFTEAALAKPFNLKQPPPHPGLPLPRRKKRKVSEPLIDVPAETIGKVEPELPAQIWSAVERDLFHVRARPVATLMMWLANADNHLDNTEFAVFEELVRSEAARLGLPDDQKNTQDLAAELFAIRPSLADVEEAARFVMSNEDVRKSLSPWLKAVSYADGKFVEAERDALHELTAALRSAV